MQCTHLFHVCLRYHMQGDFICLRRTLLTGQNFSINQVLDRMIVIIMFWFVSLLVPPLPRVALSL